jgi:hypothetical protein
MQIERQSGKGGSRVQSPAKQIAGFIAKFDAANAKLIRAARAAMRKRLPTAYEMVYDNYNFLVFGFGPTERPSDAILSLAAGANGLGLCFIQGAKLRDPDGILQGSGNQTRFLRVPTVATLREPAVERLIAAAIVAGKPFPKAGRGSTVVRSVSAKQRPRR